MHRCRQKMRLDEHGHAWLGDNLRAEIVSSREANAHVEAESFTERIYFSRQGNRKPFS